MMQIQRFAMPDQAKKKYGELMQRGRRVFVIIKGNEDQGEPGELRIQEWNKRERVMRAMKFGGACWGFAIFSVILPLLHFVLVPGFLIAGPIIAFVVFGQEAVVLGGSGTCPHCKKTMKIVRNAPRFPLSDMCEHCQKSVEVEIADHFSNDKGK